MTFADMCGGYDFGKPLDTFELDPDHADFVLKVAREWQSPGSIGCELATLASTRCVTDELASDISATIREALAPYAGKDRFPGEVALGIMELELIAGMLKLDITLPERWGF